MNDYIIHPIWFYIMHLSGAFWWFAFGALIVIGVTIIVTGIVAADEADEKLPKKTHLIFWFIVCAIFVTLIPSQKTVKEMIIASHITKSNIEYTQETLKDTIDYIIDKVENKEVKE